MKCRMQMSIRNFSISSCLVDISSSHLVGVAKEFNILQVREIFKMGASLNKMVKWNKIENRIWKKKKKKMKVVFTSVLTHTGLIMMWR